MRNGIKINYMYFPLVIASSRLSRYHLGKNGSVFTAIPWKVFSAFFLLYFFCGKNRSVSIFIVFNTLVSKKEEICL